MEIQQNANTSIIKNFEIDLTTFVANLKLQFESYQNQNIIIDISNLKGLKNKDLIVFLDCIKMSKKNKKSFVVVISDFDFNKATAKINVVPTIQEAHDIIEMEEIERDLGF
jgi:hypothetical protein